MNNEEVLGKEKYIDSKVLGSMWLEIYIYNEYQFFGLNYSFTSIGSNFKLFKTVLVQKINTYMSTN